MLSEVFPTVSPQLGVVPAVAPTVQALIPVLWGILVAVLGMLAAMFKPSSLKKLGLLLWSQKLVVVPTALLVGGTIYFWGDIFPATGGGGKQEVGTDWTVMRQGPARLGVQSGSVEEPGRGQVNWRYNKRDAVKFFSSPAVVGNRVYATASAANLTSGSIVSIDADSGQLVWQFSADKYRATFSSPSVAGNYLVVGEGLHTTRDSRVFCLDIAASEKKGRGVKLWEFRTNSHVESSPAIWDGKVYVGAGDDGVYCLDIKGDGKGRAKRVWHIPGDKYKDCEPSPVVVDGKVYFGLGEGAKAVVCVDAKTGEEIWQTPVDYPAFGSPAVVDGKVVVGMGIGNYIQSAEDVLGARQKMLYGKGLSEDQLQAELQKLRQEIYPAGAVWCLDAVDGKVLWKFEQVERTVLGSPAIKDGKVYFGSRDKFVYCVSLEDGSLVRRFNVRAPVVCGLAVGESTLYAVTQFGQLYGLDLETFKPVWTMQLGSASISSPAIARGRLYVGSDNGLVSAGSSGRLREPSIWPAAIGVGGQTGWDSSDVPPRVGLAWRWTADQETPPVISAPMAMLDDVGAMFAAVPLEGQSGVARLDIVENNEVTKPRLKWHARSDKPVVLSPVASNKTLFFIEGAAGDESRKLRAVNVADGKDLWDRPIESGASGAMALDRGYLYVADKAGAYSCLTHDGKEVWSHKSSQAGVGMMSVAADWVFLADAPDALVCLDKTGTTRWSRKVGAMAAAPTVLGQLLLVPLAGEQGRLLVIDIPTARDVVTIDLGGESAGSVVVGQGLLVAPVKGISQPTLVGDGSAGVKYDAKLAKRLAAEEFNLPVLAVPTEGPVIASLDALLYVTDKGLERLDLMTGRSTVLQRIYPENEGRLTTPLLVLKSHILYGTEKRGLACHKPSRR